MARRMLVLGLDSMPPSVLYSKRAWELMPYTAGLVSSSARYVMRSCHPPITVPAWMVMFTGKTPGELGVYGFRHRRPGEFKAYIVDSTRIKAETLWDAAGKRGLYSIVFGVPPTYPPKPVHGVLVTDFTTPGPDKQYTWPPWLKRELEAAVGPMRFDIVYRSHDKDRVRRDLLEMVKQHLQAVEYLAKKRKWNLLVYVEIGVDRAHHAFWRYFDEKHPRHEEHPVYSNVIPEVYRMIDEWLEKIHKEVAKDAIVVVVSDHGTKPMKGAFTINQWLEEKGYLKLKEKPSKPGTDLEEDMIDWSKTLAWAWGGYYSRVFINLKGREKHGIVDEKDYWSLLEQLKRDIAAITGPAGEPWRNMAYHPSELYPETRGDPPDLMVYLDNLDWRPAGTIGWPTKHLPENDRGPDDAVHDWDGVLAVYDPEGVLGTGDKGMVRAHEVRGLLQKLLLEEE